MAIILEIVFHCHRIIVRRVITGLALAIASVIMQVAHAEKLHLVWGWVGGEGGLGAKNRMRNGERRSENRERSTHHTLYLNTKTPTCLL